MHDRVARGRHAARLAALLSNTGLTSSLGAAAAILIAGWALPARADGGNGGGVAGTGGADSSNGTGGAGGPDPGGGGGGGAGQTGGQGGFGNVPIGGLGGQTPGANGQFGADGTGGGGGGGGGGAHGQVVVAPGTLVSATGGRGGLGGDGVVGGGGGGAGGWGTSVISAGSFTNAGTVRGGNGGNGGNGDTLIGFGGSGGSGGLGLFFSGGSTSLVNSGTIAGGQGGLAGAGVLAGTPGAGGTGIVGGGGGFTIVNSGTISGGFANAGSGAQANAITFSGGGTNSLTLQAGSIISGNVVAFFGGSDVLALGGSGNATFNVSQIGPAAQYENFANFQKTGSSTWTLTGTTASTTNWAINGGTLAISADNNLGGAGGIPSFNGGTLQFTASLTSTRAFTLNAGGGTFDTNGNAVTLSGGIGGLGGLTKIGAGTLTLAGAGDYLGGTNINGGTLALAVASALGGGTLSFNGGTLQVNSSMALSPPTTLNAGGGTINTNGFSLGFGATISGPGGLTKIGAGTLMFGAPMTYSGGTTVNAGTLQLLSGSSLNAAGALMVNGGTFDLSQFDGPLTVGALSGTGGTIALGSNPTSSTLTTNSAANTMLASQITGDRGLIKQGSGILALTANNTYTGGTTVTGGLINFAALNNFGTGMVTLNGGGVQWATGNTLDISSRLMPLGAAGGTFDTNGNNVSFATPISGTGGLTKAGNGILTFTNNNSYSGGTVVTGGLINFNAASNFGSGLITLNGGGLQWAAGSSADISAKLAPLGAGGGTFDTNGNTVTFATGLTGSGGLAKQGLGTLNLTGNSTYTGGTAVFAGTLSVNGSVAGNVAVGSAGTLGGNGTIAGNVVNAGTLAPGNSIGLLTVNGSYTQMAGSTYQVEANAQGQGDRINVGGAAAIQGGTVQVLAAAGSYANSTTYTIVRASGGVSGTYAGVTSNFAFLTPTLSYDANDVFLTLALPGQNAFTPTFLALTPNQKAVGVALNQSFANASGDFATVIGVLAGLNTVQGPLALNTISGEPYADFGTMNTNNSMMFMNAIGQQMANARGASAAGQRQALAQACEIEACDGTGPLSAWVSALGGLGSVLGDSNASTLTYNFGGAAAGIDYRFDPPFLLGIGAGYTHGTQWVNTFMGQGWSDSVSVAAYGSFTQGGFYLDVLAGYAYFNNQLQRQILIPGLQQRTATGSTGANQFLGQAEGGYKLGVYAPAAATITPFGRFQISSVTQNAFSESGAQSLSLNVAQQTTNSQRTTIGADLASPIGLGNERKLDVAVRLGWQHEFADTGRPITAAFAGAPGNSFTVFGVTPARDAAVVGFQATTSIAAATQVYLRYDGGVGGGTDNHAINVGLRMNW